MVMIVRKKSFAVIVVVVAVVLATDDADDVSSGISVKNSQYRFHTSNIKQY
jgi:hypothetical protein